MRKALCLLLLLSACAGQADEKDAALPQTQTVFVRTPGIPKADCFVIAGGVSTPVETPAHVRVPRGQGDLVISCSKGPHVSGHAVIPAQFASSEKGAVDCKSCNYPEDIVVPMTIRPESVR